MGLGNPGPGYADTRHNAGFLLAFHLVARWGWPPFRREVRARVARGVRGERPGLIALPETYMNRSGEALAPWCTDPAFAPRDLLILVDDVALPLGSFRLRATGRAAGHHGLESIEETLGTREYARLRIGIGPVPEDEGDLAAFVLAPFTPAERARLDERLDLMSDAVACWYDDGITTAMNRFNRRETP